MRHVLAALLLWSIANTAFAAEMSLPASIKAWLQGDDATSLPALANLASEGDPDARILLAQIDFASRSYGPFLSSLSRVERKALFRFMTQRNSLGTSWLRVEADEGNELAAAFLAARMPNPGVDLIETLSAMGERQATNHPTRIVALYGTAEEKRDLLSSDAVLDILRPYLTYNISQAEPRGDGLAALRHLSGHIAITANDPDALGIAGILALGFPYGDVSANNPWRPEVEDWLMSARETQPIADVCSEACGAEAGSCAFALMALTGGYYEVVRLSSPYEKVLSQSTFLASPRARLMALDRASFTRAETDEVLASIQEIAEMSSCAAALVENTRATR